MKNLPLLILLIASLLAACSPAVTVTPPAPPTKTTLPTSTKTPTATIIPSPTLTSTPTPAPMSAKISGMIYDPGFGFKDAFLNPTSDAQIVNVIKPMGVNWVAIFASCYMSTIHSPVVRCDESLGVPNDASLRHAIALAKSQGLRVLFKPGILIQETGIALDVRMQSEADWQSFFDSYGAAMVHWAELSEETGVDYFAVGTEMSGTQQRETEWRQLIQDVRAVYSGPLTYCANSGSETGVTWWDALDAIGVDAYYPLVVSENPTVEQIKTAWTPYVTLLDGLAKKWGKSIIFTEAGYTSQNMSLRTPWGDRSDQPIDLQEQADGYQALLETFSDKPWWQGVFWFHQSAAPVEGGIAGQLWEIDGKPAENVLRAYNGQPPFPTPTLIPNYDSPNNHILVIYNDGLDPAWELPSVFTWADPGSSEQVYAGSQALKVHLEPWTNIDLWVNAPVDTSEYDFLEFYIYITALRGDYYPNINVYFNAETGPAILHMPDIMRPGYVEGGELSTGKWLRVRIPMSELGAIDQKIITLSFGHHTATGTVDFYLDEIALVKHVK